MISRSEAQAQAHLQPKSAQTSMAAIESQPHIVFRDTELGSQYGLVAMVSLADPSGPRAVSST